MKLFSRKTLLEVLTSIFLNLTSAWFGVLLVIPGLYGVASPEQYQRLLTANLPFAIVGLTISLILTEQKRQL